jgi:hypothetical protein
MQGYQGGLLMKTIKGIIIVNWKTGSLKCVKRRTNKTGNYEIPINIAINIQEPELKTHEIKADIIIPEAKFKGAFMENFIEECK